MSAHPGFASRLFVSGSLAFILIGILGAAQGATLPAFSAIHGLTPGAAGLFITCHALGSILAVLAAAVGVRGLGPRTAAALVAAGAGVIALGPNWAVTLGGALLAGAGFGLIAALVNRAFLTGFGPRGPGMVGIVNAISGIGSIAAPLVFVALGGVPALLFAVIAVMAAALIPIFAPAAPADEAAAQAPQGSLLRPRMSVLLLNHISTGMEASLIGFGVSALIAMGRAETAAQFLASGFFVAFLLSRLAFYWLSRIVAPDTLFLVATLGTAGAAALAAAGAPAIGHVIAGAFVGLAFPSFYIWGTRVLGPDPRMSAAILLSGLSGVLVGPLAFGAAVGVLGLDRLHLVAAVVALALAAAALAGRVLVPASGGADAAPRRA